MSETGELRKLIREDRTYAEMPFALAALARIETRVKVLEDALREIRDFAAKEAPPADVSMGDDVDNNDPEPWWTFWTMANAALAASPTMTPASEPQRDRHGHVIEDEPSAWRAIQAAAASPSVCPTCGVPSDAGTNCAPTMTVDPEE